MTINVPKINGFIFALALLAIGYYFFKAVPKPNVGSAVDSKAAYRTP